MQFNDSANDAGICQEIDDICGSTVNTFPLTKKARRVNDALDAFYKIAIEEDTNWIFDDSNYAPDLPLAYINIQSGVQDYPIENDLYVLDQIYVKDSQGLFSELPILDRDDVRAKNIFEVPSNSTGNPVRAEIVGNSLLLDPIPNYNSSNGIKMVVHRAASYMDSNDTVKEPGIPAIFHPYLARKASIPFLVEKKLPQLQGILKLVGSNNPNDPYYGGDELQIATFIAGRNRVRRPKIIPKFRSAR